MVPKSNNNNKDHFQNAIMLLYKGQDQIAESSVASNYGISKSLCLCDNMIFMKWMINCADSGSQKEFFNYCIYMGMRHNTSVFIFALKRITYRNGFMCLCI